MNLIHTYRGNIQGTCLEDGEKLLNSFFDEIHTNGQISEMSYDINGVPHDRDLKGNIIKRPNEIQLENRHWAKILSSNMQIRERRHFLDKKGMKEYKSTKACFELENKDYELNVQCEKKFVAIVYASNKNTPYDKDMATSVSATQYSSVCRDLSVEVLTEFKDKVYKDEFRAFVRVRANRCISGGRINFSNVPAKNKDTLIEKCIEDKDKPIGARLVPIAPPLPELLEPEMYESV